LQWKVTNHRAAKQFGRSAVLLGEFPIVVRATAEVRRVEDPRIALLATPQHHQKVMQ
jgi:hypothetical protein